MNLFTSIWMAAVPYSLLLEQGEEEGYEEEYEESYTRLV